MSSRPGSIASPVSGPRTMMAITLSLFAILSSPIARADDLPAAAKAGSGKIIGKVLLDQGGQPLTGAEVTLLLPPPPGKDFYVWPLPLRHAMSDAEGQFQFDNLPAGAYRVWANHEKLTSRRDTLTGARVTIPESGEQPKPVELRMFPGVAVTARVLSKASGKPIPNAIVHFGWSDFKHDNFATDDEGRVTLQPLKDTNGKSGNGLWPIEPTARSGSRSGSLRSTRQISPRTLDGCSTPRGNPLREPRCG